MSDSEDTDPFPFQRNSNGAGSGIRLTQSMKKEAAPSQPLSMRRLMGRLAEPHSHAQVASIAFALGGICGAGFLYAGLAEHWRHAGLYLGLLSIFHLLEYLTTAMHRPDVGMNAFMLNHSREYHIALSFGLIEYFVEAALFPTWKQFGYWNIVGAVLVLFFQFLRSLAMLTAGANFTHLISFRKERSHVLVTDGIYRYLRHPAYTSFFYYGPCLQLGVLMNPVAFVANVIVLHRFFKNRIEVEESLLVDFFGQEYEDYRTKSWVLIPGL
ncbi:hypothetical protein HDU77_008269 [Chytriomyces hyalinus]|nr:hypothetical protein HDU77_008269 [Chytriomyces hyalinus]